jgi:hypothetical protein
MSRFLKFNALFARSKVRAWNILANGWSADLYP